MLISLESSLFPLLPLAGFCCNVFHIPNTLSQLVPCPQTPPLLHLILLLPPSPPLSRWTPTELAVCCFGSYQSGSFLGQQIMPISQLFCHLKRLSPLKSHDDTWPSYLGPGCHKQLICCSSMLPIFTWGKKGIISPQTMKLKGKLKIEGNKSTNKLTM